MRLRLALTSCGLLLAACGGGGSSAPPLPAPTAPTNVTATAKDGYVLLNANSVPGATAYRIYWANSTGVTPASGTRLDVGSSPQAHTGLTNGTQYCYVVTAVGAGGESAPSSQVCATPTAATTAPDPLFADQWHLKNIGQSGASGPAGTTGEDINVQPAWTGGATGAGIKIAIVDDGLELAHEDLASNAAANALHYNYDTGLNDPSNNPADAASGHGTAVAGIAAARGNNGLGGSGVAPRASLLGYALLLNPTSSNAADAMTRNVPNLDISSNSWGPPDGSGNPQPGSALWKSAIDSGLASGRGGKGTVYVWAAGNGRSGSATCTACSDDSNLDGQANYRGVMAVAAVNDQGVQSSYSESGANVWVAAPGGEFCTTHTLTTTDRSGAVGENTASTAGVSDYPDQNYTKCMNGTSAATPVVSGVVALMLEKNPNLGWRDVRAILAQTARANNFGTCTRYDTVNTTLCLTTNTGWVLNGAGTPSASNLRYYVNHKYGFGVVDAAAAVIAAQTWANLPIEKTYTTTAAAPNLPIPDNNATGVSHTIMVSGSSITYIEWVEITFSAADHTYAGDLDITLTAPSGMVSQLAVPHQCETSCTAYNGWIFGSAQHLGEAADGNWTLTVKDAGALDTGTFQSWQLKFYGH